MTEIGAYSWGVKMAYTGGGKGNGNQLGFYACMLVPTPTRSATVFRWWSEIGAYSWGSRWRCPPLPPENLKKGEGKVGKKTGGGEVEKRGKFAKLLLIFQIFVDNIDILFYVNFIFALSVKIYKLAILYIVLWKFYNAEQIWIPNMYLALNVIFSNTSVSDLHLSNKDPDPNT